MTRAKESTLEQASYICYPVQFQKEKCRFSGQYNLDSHVGFDDQDDHDSHVGFNDQSGHDSHVGFEANMVTIVITSCFAQKKLGKVWFFQKTFLLADISIPFFIFCSADIQLAENLSVGLIQLLKPCQQLSWWNFSVQRNLWRQPEWTMIKPLWLNLKGQECLCYNPCRLFGPQRPFFSRLHYETTWAQRHQWSSYQSGFPSRQFARRCCNIIHPQDGSLWLYVWSWPSRTGTHNRWSRI